MFGFDGLKQKSIDKAAAEESRKQKKAEEKKQKKTNVIQDYLEEHAPILYGYLGGEKKNPEYRNSDVKGKPTAGQPTTGKPAVGKPITGKPATGNPMTEIPSSLQVLSSTITYAGEKFESNKNDIAEGIKRGKSQVAELARSGYKIVFDPVLDRIEFILQLRGDILEKYPVLAYPGEQARAFTAGVRNGFIEGADWLGNEAYEADIPILSDFAGGLFDASSMEDSKSPASVFGSFLNGGVRSVLGMVDGVATIATDPVGTLEGVTKIARDPDVYAPAMWDSANAYLEENLTNGSAEDRAKLAGGICVELATTILTFGAGKAAKAGKAGKIADAADTVADVANASDTALDVIRAIPRTLDEIGDTRGGASRWIDKVDDAPPRKGVSIESTGKGGSGAPLKYNPTSGVSLKATPGKTTTILGTYADDTGNILNELGNTKSMDFGPRDGGFNLLNTPDEIYNQLGPDGFWNQCNKPWLDNAIARNDIIVLATEPTENILYRINKVTGVKELSGFGRECQYLIDHGYVFDSALKQMIKK